MIEFCKYLLYCGLCELTKEKCSQWTIASTWDMPTPPTKEWKVGDWPPGPQPTCKDLASNPDTFRVHYEDLPRC